MYNNGFKLYLKIQSFKDRLFKWNIFWNNTAEGKWYLPI